MKRASPGAWRRVNWKQQSLLACILFSSGAAASSSSSQSYRAVNSNNKLSPILPLQPRRPRPRPPPRPRRLRGFSPTFAHPLVSYFHFPSLSRTRRAILRERLALFLVLRCCRSPSPCARRRRPRCTSTDSRAAFQDTPCLRVFLGSLCPSPQVNDLTAPERLEPVFFLYFSLRGIRQHDY